MILYDKFIMRFKNKEMEIKLQHHAETLTKKDIPFLIGLSLLGLFLFLFYTWAMPLIDPDEPRYASTACDMVTERQLDCPAL